MTSQGFDELQENHAKNDGHDDDHQNENQGRIHLGIVEEDAGQKVSFHPQVVTRNASCFQSNDDAEQ